MYFRRFVCLGVLSLAFFAVSFAQTSPTESASEKEKAQKKLEKHALEMIDQAVAEAKTLIHI